jgi:RND family efflux transporter MFP subunit
MRILLVTALLIGAAGASAAWADPIQAITRPSEDVTLSCSRPGLIARILKQEGEAVKVDEPVVQQDAREEEAMLAADKAKAEDVTRIKAQEAIRDQSKVDLDRVVWAAKEGVKSQFELDKARIDVVVAEAQVKMAQVEQEQAKLKYDQSKVVVDKMTLTSPINGLVEQVLAKAGESVELNTKVMRIVNINPLWIEVQVPLAQARQLKLAATGKVIFSDQSTREGTVTFIAAVADAASDTLRVRLTVANPDLRKAGEQVQVDLGATGRVAGNR